MADGTARFQFDEHVGTMLLLPRIGVRFVCFGFDVFASERCGSGSGSTDSCDTTIDDESKKDMRGRVARLPARLRTAAEAEGISYHFRLKSTARYCFFFALFLSFYFSFADAIRAICRQRQTKMRSSTTQPPWEHSRRCLCSSINQLV